MTKESEKGTPAPQGGEGEEIKVIKEDAASTPANPAPTPPDNPTTPTPVPTPKKGFDPKGLNIGDKVQFVVNEGDKPTVITVDQAFLDAPQTDEVYEKYGYEKL